MFAVGLTGGIGSGKTTVSNLFAEKGIEVIDTDLIAREVTEPHTRCYNSIIEKFGELVLDPSKRLNRAKLREMIFNDANLRLWLERLLHPEIRKITNQRILSCQTPYCIVVIPLLFETTPNPLLKRYLVVHSSLENQRLRTHLRDQIPSDDVQKIIDSQLAPDIRLKKAHDILLNDGSIEDLKNQIDALHDLYLFLAASNR